MMVDFSCHAVTENSCKILLVAIPSPIAYDFWQVQDGGHSSKDMLFQLRLQNCWYFNGLEAYNSCPVYVC